MAEPRRQADQIDGGRAIGEIHHDLGKPRLHPNGGPDTVSNMKTTVDIADALLEEAKRVAAGDGITLRELIEAGLRQALKSRRRAGAFKLRKASFRGKGLQPTLRGAPWERLRELAYEGRGS